MSSKRSKVHPKYKTKYRVTNWAAYDRALVARGDITLWITPEALEAWRPAPAGRRGWRKLHLSADAHGMILAQCLTEATADDANTAIELLDTIKGTITCVTADGAYDTTAFYEAAGNRGARVVVPPSTAATASRKPRARASPRNRTIERVQETGRRAWKKEARYHQQARAENAFFRYKTSSVTACALEASPDAESRRASPATSSIV